jgi:acetyl esterase/lipase
MITLLLRFALIALTALIFVTQVNGQTQNQSIRLWPGAAPGSLGNEPADVPTITPYMPPRDRATGAAVIVCPGGGYQMLADHEGRPVAEWLNSIGIAAFVLKYRIAPRYHHPSPMLDAQRALRTVRARAAQWGIDPRRIGILGFSAGGHLASTAATHFDAGASNTSDAIERASSRPDLVILIYPVITMREQTHAGSKKNLLGDHPDAQMVALMSNDEQVTKQTPPAFLIHTVNDEAVPVENSLRFAAALGRAGVAYEMHLYERGPHGFGLGTNDPVLSSWPERCADWLRLHGFAAPQR